MTDLKYSVIIPCFNSQDHVLNALNSVKNQSLNPSNYEIILINDGSIDFTLDLVKKFKSQNSHISMSIIDQNNKGLSYSRNKGIELSKGERIIFLDSDDELVFNCLENLTEHSEDIVFIGRITFDGEKRIKEKIILHQSKFDFMKSPELIIIGAQYYCYKKSFLINENLRFKINLLHEDLLFVPIAIQKSKNMSSITSNGYIRNITENSISSTPSFKRCNDYLIILNSFISMNINSFYFDYFKYRALTNGLILSTQINLRAVFSYFKQIPRISIKSIKLKNRNKVKFIIIMGISKLFKMISK